MAKLFLLRHLKSQWNLENRFAGWVDNPVSKEGSEQAKGVAEKMTGEKFDVIYTGHIVSQKILDIIDSISHFNYRFISNSAHPSVTDKNKNYLEKLSLVSESKISVVSNLLYPKPIHILNLWLTKGFNENCAFRSVPKRWDLSGLFNYDNIEIPQIKSRVFEAAFCRSLILCQRDEFNIIENFFKPDDEFIYYEKGKLTGKISEILSNFSKYELVVENAYKKATQEYTVAKFYSQFLKDLKI